MDSLKFKIMEIAQESEKRANDERELADIHAMLTLQFAGQGKMQSAEKRPPTSNHSSPSRGSEWKYVVEDIDSDCERRTTMFSDGKHSFQSQVRHRVITEKHCNTEEAVSQRDPSMN